MTTPRVVLHPRRAKPFHGHHPWVFAGAVAAVEGEPADGAEVDLVNHTGGFVARGLYNSKSKICVRLYSWQPDVPLDRAFFRARLDTAIRLRHDILGLHGPGSACRLVFSEADGLSGCVIDRYDRWLVIQFTALALASRQELFVELLRELLQPEGIIVRTERGIKQLEGLELQDGPVWGTVPSEPITIVEDGLSFLVHLTEGQKTGFYLDQRDNRRAVAALARGRRVLDAFCYTGGFGLHAAHGGATAVLGIDVSEPALNLARENARRNGLTQIEYVKHDVFDHLDTLVQAKEQFGLVILDPPKFARSRNSIDEALRGYRRLHTLAMRLLARDGILVTCCCSGLISHDMLTALLAQLASEERRELQLLQQRGPAPDHPVSVSCLETNYLKCLVSRLQ